MNFDEAAVLSAFLWHKTSGDTLKQIEKRYGSFRAGWDADLRGISFKNSEEKESLLDRKPALPQQYVKICQRDSIQVLTTSSDAYPVLLKETGMQPFALFVRGDISLLSAVPTVAVVGTRRMSDYGKQVLREIIPPLVRAGVVIVSGLAQGVDGLAHEIALEHGGKCVAVLGNGVNTIFPSHHKHLARKILDTGGTIISEQGVGVPGLKQNFPARNRIISGLSKATIVVEAKEKSGSLITAKFALEQNRDVFAVPGNIFLPNQRGTNRLISEGATPIYSVPFLMDQLHLGTEEQKEQGTLPVAVFDSPEEKLLYEHLREPRSIDELSVELRKGVSELAQTLSLMEIKGMVKNLGMRFSR